MRRSSILLLLLLLPLTMAPRTSLTPDGVPLDVVVVVSQTEVDPGDHLSVVVQARNATDAVLEDARLSVVLAWTGKADTLTFPRVPRGCSLTKPGDDTAPE